MVLKTMPFTVFRLAMWMFDAQLGILTQTTQEVLDSITTNQKLAGVLSYIYGDYGEVPERGAFLMHALVMAHYRGGAYYPVGGPLEIAKSATRVLEKWGVKVLVRAPVSSILINDRNQAIGVLIKGHTIRAKRVVSSIGVPLTFTKLIPDTHRHLVQPFVDQIQDPQVTSQMSLMSMFVGLDDPKGELTLPRSNYWIFPSWDHGANNRVYGKDPGKPSAFFLSFSSAKDPSYATRYPGKQVALIIGPALVDNVEPFNNDRVKHRQQAYLDMKETWKRMYLQVLLDHFPECREKIDFTDFGTAVTNDFYLGTYRGAVYGLGHTPKRFQLPWLKPGVSHIQKLYLSGQDVTSCGINGAILGGYWCAYYISPWSYLYHCVHGLQ